MSIEMTTTTDHAEIRNSADDDGQFEFLGILSHLADENDSLRIKVAERDAMIATDDIELQATDATIERLRAGIRVERFISLGLGFTGVAARLDALLARS